MTAPVPSAVAPAGSSREMEMPDACPRTRPALLPLSHIQVIDIPFDRLNVDGVQNAAALRYQTW